MELDGAAAALAASYLGLEGVDVIVGDALDHASLAPGSYDVVALDVYGDDDRVPAPFRTAAFAESVADALAPGGVFVANYHVGGRAGTDRSVGLGPFRNPDGTRGAAATRPYGISRILKAP